MKLNKKTLDSIEQAKAEGRATEGPHVPPLTHRQPAKKHKYGARASEVFGIKFQSKREASRWNVLQLFEQQGTITNLKRQVVFDLHAPGGGKVTSYIADFTYEEGGVFVCEDAKGFRTRMYQMKRKWMLLEHGIRIREV